MVPSDPSVNSFSDRHARSEHGIRDAVTLDLCSPPPVLAGCGSMLRCASAVLRLGRSSLFDTAFRSPAATAYLFRSATAAGSTLLACIFKAIPKSPLSPFGPALPPPPGVFCSPSGARSIHGTRCQVRFRNFPPVFGPPLPSRISQSFGIEALCPNPGSVAYPCELPDFPSLPVALQIISYLISATDHRSGSATSRQAHCPSNLLEPYS